jgi:hypothetical protein
VPVEALEARRRRVIHGQDEAEVDRVPETLAVLAEGVPLGRRGSVSSCPPLAGTRADASTRS